VALFSAELEQGGLAFPTPAMTLTRDHDTLRSAGLSARKAEYIHSLAEAFTNGDVTPEFFATANDQEIVDRLTAIRGIGGVYPIHHLFITFNTLRQYGRPKCSSCSVCGEWTYSPPGTWESSAVWPHLQGKMSSLSKLVVKGNGST
jgi:hypothetical protein